MSPLHRRRAGVGSLVVFAALFAACAPAVATSASGARSAELPPPPAIPPLPPAPPPPAPPTLTEYAARRDSLAARITDGVIVVFGSPEPVEDYVEFYQNPNFLYLTGLDDPNAVLVGVKKGGVTRFTLFVEEAPIEREVWVGSRPGIAGARRRTGLDVRPLEEIAALRDTLLASADRLYVVSGVSLPSGHSGRAEQMVRAVREKRPNLPISPADRIVAGLRARKSDAELGLIRRAVEISVSGQLAGIRAVAPGRFEYEVEAEIERAFRSAGAERPSFASIVGSGPNSTILHYVRNDRLMHAGEVVVMDVGASYRGYAGDVTRTVPVSGRFSPEQREIYSIVRAAQEAAARAALPGAPAQAMNTAALAVLTEGLARLSLIESPAATYDCGSARCPQYRLYYMHGLGHAIGLDVHDPGTSGVQLGALQPGDVFSIEPGIYVRENVLDLIASTPGNDRLKRSIAAAVRRYANIGVRIEDDYLVTRTGLEWLSRAPREIEEIEAAMARR